MSELMWFGTEERMQWITAPLSGANMTPEGWGTGGTLLSGGGFQSNSWGTHKNYTFEWSGASSLEAAQLMKSYRDGTYGRGLIYFIDPLTYGRNVLPARLADPSMAVGDESASLVYDASPAPLSSGATAASGLPVGGALYNLSGVAANIRANESTFIPIPEGYTLHLTAMYSATGTGGIFATPQISKGTLGTAVRLTANAVSATSPVSHAFASTAASGVRIWLGRTSTAASTVSAYAMIGRLVKTGRPAPTGPWIGGMGHSGVRFSSPPTYTANNGVGGGQAGYAASFREVGSWSYA